MQNISSSFWKIFILATALTLLSVSAQALDAPHNVSFATGCLSCHDMTSNAPNLIPTDTYTPDPLDIDHTLNNSVCEKCHIDGPDGTAPYVPTHSSQQTDESYGQWTVECRVCHNQHSQDQFKNYGTASYVYTGTNGGVNNAGADAIITVTGPAMTPDQYAGYIVAPNTARLNYNYKIIGNTVDTLTVEGSVNTTYAATGSQLAISYGKFIRSSINLANIGKTGSKAVRFFKPTGPNSFADGDPANIDGICEVCHTLTSHWRNDGSFAAVGVHDGLQATNCMSCHPHSEGFKADCGACHGFPPADGATLVTSPGPTGSATAGAHIEHSTNQAIGCDACHYKNFPDGEHNNGAPLSVTIGFGPNPPIPQGGSYDGQALVPYDRTTTTPETTVSNTGSKTCSALYCHGNYAGSGLNATPIWDNPVSGDCGTCHYASNTTPPTDTAPSTSHRWHAATADTATQGSSGYNFNCATCHDNVVDGNGPASYTIADKTKHVNGSLEWQFNSADPRISGTSSYSIATGTEAPSNGITRAFGTCSAVYCHSNGQPAGGIGAPDYKTPQWGVNDTCGSATGCHPVDASHDATGTRMNSGSHTAHLAYTFNLSSSRRQCTTCHKWNQNAVFNSGCTACHGSVEAHTARNTFHVNKQVDLRFETNFTGNTAAYNGTPAPGDGYSTCSVTYCHGDGTSVASGIINANTTPNWGTAGPLACNSCHANAPAYANGTPKANSHSEHIAAGFTCDKCHFATTTDNTTIASKANHVNRSYTVTPNVGAGIDFTYIFAATGGTCASISCHANNPATWGVGVDHNLIAVPLCLSCHTATNAPFYGAGEVHETQSCATCHDSANNAELQGSAIGATPDDSCTDCHAGYFEGHGHSHNFTASAACAACHGNPSPIGSNARDAAATPFTGAGEVHGTLACATCHNTAVDGALTGSAVGNEIATGCIDCHSATWAATHTNATGVDHTGRADGLATCTTCHTATAGGAGGLMPVAGGDNQVHDACTTCHTADGLPLQTTPTPNGWATAVAAGNCGTCHGAGYFDSHVHGTTGGYVEHDVTYATLVDLSQVSMAGDNPCADCHSGNNADGNGTPLDSWTDILSEHVTGCARCHSYVDGGDGTPPQATNDNTIASGVGVICTSCHTPKLDPAVTSDHGGHDNTQFGWSGNCQNCHGAGAGAEAVVSVIHGNDCNLCHTGGTYNAATNGAGPVTNGIDGDAGLAEGDAGTWAATCTTCHAIAGSVNAGTIGGIHHENQTDGVVAEVDCATCHTVIGHEGNHTTLVASAANSCASCHTATAGGAAGIPVASGDDKVHDGCTTCHAIAPATARDGFLLDQPTANVNGWVTAMPNGGAGTNNGGGLCTDCHGAYFNGHTHSHSFATAAACATCHNLDNADGSNASDAIATPFVGGTEVHGASACASCHDLDATPTGTLIGSAIGQTGATDCTSCHIGGGNTWTSVHTADLGTGAGFVDHATRVDSIAACAACHGNAVAGSNARDAVTTPYYNGGQVHSGSGCATCHTGTNDGALRSSGLTKADQIASGTCATCHTNSSTWTTIHDTATGAAAGISHATRVDGLAACTTCHTGTAGGAAGVMPYNAGDDKVHDACSVCHQASGVLQAGNTTYGNQPITAGTCGTCHSATYFDSHVHGTTAGYVSHDVSYAPLVDLSQVSMAGDNPCADCHSGNNADGNGTPLDSWTDILSEHVTGCARCHSYVDGGDGTPPQATNDNTIASGVGVICTSCHTPKLDPAVTSDHGGHAPAHFGWAGGCQSCHGAGLAAEEVVAAIHGNTCDLCHTTGGPYNATTEKLGANGDGDARLANGAAAAATPFDPTVYTCTTCHNQAQVPGFHGTTIAQVTSSHQLSSDSSGGYDCESCHSANIGNEQLSTHMPADTVANCTAVCHGNTTPSATSGIVAKTVIDNVTWLDPAPNQNNSKCENCHAAKGDYRRHGLTDDASAADGIGDGTGGVVFHDNLGNSTGIAPTFTGKLAPASYGGLLATEYNCGQCHSANPDSLDGSSNPNISDLEAMLLHTISGGGSGDCLTCHVNAASVADEITAGIGGTVQYCENCHASVNGNGPSGKAMYQYDGSRHHTTPHAQAGDCTWCHADPRPTTINTTGSGFAHNADEETSDAAAALGTYTTGWVSDYSVTYPVNTTGQPDLAGNAGIPKQPACRLCHTNYGTDGIGTPHSVDVSGGNGNHGYNIAGYSGTATERTTGLTVYRNDFNAGNSGAGDDANLPVTATRITQTVIHRIDANNATSMIKVYDYGACFGCHSVQVMHAAPIPGTDYPAVINDPNYFPFDTLRYAPGRTVFNLLRGDNPDNGTDGDVSGWNQHRLQANNGMQNLFGQQPAADPRGKDLLKNMSDSAPNVSTAADWNFNSVLTYSRLDIPLGVFSHPENPAPNPSGQTPAANHEPFAAYFADIAAPSVPDGVQFISASWDGANVTVRAVNDDGCAALSARTQPDGIQRVAPGGFAAGPPCSATFALGSIAGVTLDIETTNAAGTDDTGNAITDDSGPVAAGAVNDVFGALPSVGTALDVLTNDSGTDLQVVVATVSSVTKTGGAGTCGTLTPNTANITYNGGTGTADCEFTYEAQAYDGATPFDAASQATVTVTQTPNAAPTLSISEPSGQTGQPLASPVAITYSLADSDDVVTVAFSLDDDTNSGNGIGSAITCTGGTGQGNEGINVTCTWDASAIATGGNTYYIYGVTDDGVNAPVGAYSGSITFASTLPQIEMVAPQAGSTETVNNTAADSGSFDYIIGDGDNRALIVIIGATDTATTDNNGTPTVTYGGQPLTTITQSTTATRVDLWMGYLNEEDILAKTGNSIAWNNGAAGWDKSFVHVMTFRGVKQGAPGSGQIVVNDSETLVETAFTAPVSITSKSYTWSQYDQPIYAGFHKDEGAHTTPTNFDQFTYTTSGTANNGSMSSGNRNDIATTGGTGTITVDFGGTDRKALSTAILKADVNP